MPPRSVLVSVILALLVAPVPSHGQQPVKAYGIGWLHGSSIRVYVTKDSDTDPHRCPIQGSPSWQAFMAGLREHGYFPGQNLGIECRRTEGPKG